MDYPGKGPACVLFLKDRDRILIGIPGVDDQRQAALSRGFDVGAKGALLGGARTVLIEVIEPAFPDSNDLLMLRQGPQVSGVPLPLFARLVRMNAHRAVDLVKALRDRQDVVEPTEFG